MPDPSLPLTPEKTATRSTEARIAEKAASLLRQQGGSRGQKFVRRLRGSGTKPATAAMSSDESMELLRGQ
jgi:hypothetical protein